MSEEEKKNDGGFSSQPPIAAMLSKQGALSSGNKYTNVFMPNQQQAVMEYVSEPYIPDEVQQKYPLETMLIKKRALGNETDIESWINDNEFNFIKLLRRMGYQDLAEMEALGHQYHREGQRTHGGFERDHQVMQKTLAQETLTTISQQQRQGFWSKIGRFGRGKQTADTSQVMQQ